MTPPAAPLPVARINNRAPTRFANDHGSGLIGMIGGVTIFLALMLFSVQLLVNLYATSVVTSAAYEGARQVAGARIDHSDHESVEQARLLAEEHVRDILGAVGDTATIDWGQSTDEIVALRIQVRHQRFGWPGLGAKAGSSNIDRTVRVRVERWQ